jgi:16S rRNA A1518/A1519 N6-dimethyltransferase RsmA/KsgA/DIM1 with predicted DNA glycosylase/AP lyase activity
MSNDADNTPYKVLSPTRVWLSETARQLASMHSMSEAEMAKHLLAQHRLKQAGLVQTDGKD